MIKFAAFPYYQIADVVQRYFDETYVNEQLDEQELDIDWDYFASLGDQVVVIGAFDKDGMVGMTAFQIFENAFNKDELEAENIIFSVSKEHRGKTSFKLLEESKKVLKDKGVKQISFLIINKKLGKLLERKGFEAKRTEWEARL